MKKPANSNMYTYARDCAWDLFADHLGGHIDGSLCVVSDTYPTADTRDALEKIAVAIGFPACTYVSLQAAESPQAADSAISTSGDSAISTSADSAISTSPVLGAHDVATLLESLNPMALLVIDAAAIKLLSNLYRSEIPANAYCHAQGRPCAAFSDFEQDLNDPATKQRDWAVIKKLKR